jgi:hypothetical protein
MMRAVLTVLVSSALAAALGACGVGVTRGTSTAPAAATTTPAAATTTPAATAATTTPAATAAPATATSAAAAAAATAKLTQAQRTHEYPTPVPRERVIGGWRSAVQAVQVFATTYVNWSAGSVAGRLQALAEVSIGQARSAMALAASQTACDYELRRGGISNSGTVEAIAPVLGHVHEYAVVTREQTTATQTDTYRGIAPAWHLALATVTRISGGLWVLSTWQPEN